MQVFALFLPKHKSSLHVFSWVRVAQSLVFCVVFCSSLFVVLSLFCLLSIRVTIHPAIILYCGCCLTSSSLVVYGNWCFCEKEANQKNTRTDASVRKRRIKRTPNYTPTVYQFTSTKLHWLWATPFYALDIMIHRFELLNLNIVYPTFTDVNFIQNTIHTYSVYILSI